MNKALEERGSVGGGKQGLFSSGHLKQSSQPESVAHG